MCSSYAPLKPTQNAVGFDEVNDKIARYSAKSTEDLKDYLLVRPVPVVIGNGGNFYLETVRSEHLVLTLSPQLAIVTRSYTKTLVEDCPECSFGHIGCRANTFPRNISH